MRVKEALGTAAIEAVAGYLQSCGFQILDQCWTYPGGEIAVVAADRRTLVACEVRVRTGSRHEKPLDGMTLFFTRMNRDRIKINWKFDRKAARRKFGYKRNSSKRSKT